MAEFLIASKFVFKALWNWWWIWLPPVLFSIAREAYLYWKNEKYYSGVHFVVLEIKIPEEIFKTPKAMEQVFHGLHGIHDPLNWKEKWADGRILLWASFEMVGIDGTVHFYIRVPRVYQKMVEANIFSQYPDVEISEVEDYANLVPKEIPNKDWDLWGSDFILTKSDVYPLRTYRQFETEMTKEEKKVDPLASLLELMSTLQEGEQLWIQILAKPVIEERDWKEQGEKVVKKLIGKTVEEKKGILTEMVGGVSSILISGKPPGEEEKKEEGLEALIWRLTPGEQDIIKAIEENIAKYGFEANIRFIYLARNEVFSKPKGVASTFGIFKQFSSLNLNGLRPGKTKTKVTPFVGWPYIFWKKRVLFRKRQLLRLYRKRFFPLHQKSYVLNTEELATLYHFPGRLAAPAPLLPRVEAKKGEPPPILPT